MNGGFAEYMTVAEDFAYLLPEDIEAPLLSPLLCAGIIGYRALKRCDLPPNGFLGIFGFGSSAHIVIQIAKHRGAKVFVVTRGENHQKPAKEMGADWVGASIQGIPGEVDSAILFAPVGTLVPEAMTVTLGIPIKPRVQLFPLKDANEALIQLKQDAISGTGVLVSDGDC